MNFLKFFFVSLLICLGTTASMACGCSPSTFCEVFTDTSTVIEAKVIRVYEIANSDHHFVDIEVMSFLYGAPTLPFDYDTLTIVDRNLSCDPQLYEFADLVESFVFRFDELVSEEGIPYGTFDLHLCFNQYLTIEGTSISGRFTKTGISTMDYNTFKQDVKNSCDWFQTNSISEKSPLDLKVFPNPVREDLNISTSRVQDFEYLIYSNTGAIMQSGKKMQQSDFTIDLSQCASGVYYLEIQMEGQVFHKKVIKI